MVMAFKIVIFIINVYNKLTIFLYFVFINIIFKENFQNNLVSKVTDMTLNFRNLNNLANWNVNNFNPENVRSNDVYVFRWL